MAAIEIALIDFEEVVSGDMLDVTFDFDHDLGSLLTGKTLYSEVIPDPSRNTSKEPVLKFSESDGSLTNTVISATRLELRFKKPASEMELPATKYLVSVVMGTLPGFEDKQTIIQGDFPVVFERTNKPSV